MVLEIDGSDQMRAVLLHDDPLLGEVRTRM